jgi:hypothetical protein
VPGDISDFPLGRRGYRVDQRHSTERLFTKVPHSISLTSDMNQTGTLPAGRMWLVVLGVSPCVGEVTSTVRFSGFRPDSLTG